MKTFNILPETFVLPHEYVQFVDSFTKRSNELGENRNLWIMKVCCPCQMTHVRYSTDLLNLSLWDCPVVVVFLYSMTLPKFATVMPL